MQNEITERICFELSDKSANYFPEELIGFVGAGPSNVAEPGKDTDSLNLYRPDQTQGHLLNHDAIKAFLKNFTLQEQADVLLVTGRKRKRKTRLIARRGATYYALKYADIALIYTSDKVVHVIDRESKRYMADKSLAELENELDHSIFFRANRQYIINFDFIKSFKPYQKVKLLVDMEVPNLEEPLIISQQVSPAFKKWMNDD
ncbi:MAG: LytR/AlgR family response regulator transcription factor [Ginsengibacter sp.]